MCYSGVFEGEKPISISGANGRHESTTASFLTISIITVDFQKKKFSYTKREYFIYVNVRGALYLC